MRVIDFDLIWEVGGGDFGVFLGGGERKWLGVIEVGSLFPFFVL